MQRNIITVLSLLKQLRESMVPFYYPSYKGWTTLAVSPYKKIPAVLSLAVACTDQAAVTMKSFLQVVAR